MSLNPSVAPYVRLPAWIYQPGIASSWPSPDLFVLGMLCQHMNRQSQCWPSLARLCAIAGLRRRQISYALARLWKVGAINIEYRGSPTGGRSSNRYTVAMSPACCVLFAEQFYAKHQPKKAVGVKCNAIAHKPCNTFAHRTSSTRTSLNTLKRDALPLQAPVQHVIQNIIHIHKDSNISSETTPHAR